MNLAMFREYISRESRDDEFAVRDFDVAIFKHRLQTAEFCIVESGSTQPYREREYRQLVLSCGPEHAARMHVFQRVVDLCKGGRSILHKAIDTPGGSIDEDFEWFISHGLNRDLRPPVALKPWPVDEDFPPRDRTRNAKGVF